MGTQTHQVGPPGGHRGRVDAEISHRLRRGRRAARVSSGEYACAGRPIRVTWSTAAESAHHWSRARPRLPTRLLNSCGGDVDGGLGVSGMRTDEPETGAKEATHAGQHTRRERESERERERSIDR